MKRNGHKYNAKRTVVDNITFASKAEAKRYGELKMLEKAGEIRGLVLQPWFVLCVPMLGPLAVEDFNKAPLSNERVIIGRYVADFMYERPRSLGWWERVVEDVKGMKTDTYKLKKKMFEAQYGISITEIT